MSEGWTSEELANLARSASRLRLDAAVAEISALFESAGIAMRLLKGASLAQWLYTSTEPRAYVDCDFLVAPHDFEAAEEILGAHGYQRHFDDRSMPSWWREHASEWIREADGVMIDLHRTLPGVQVDDETAWRLLSHGRHTVVVARYEVPTLGLPERALHVALHAAHHGAGWPRPIADLERALTGADEELWRSAATLAHELDAVDGFAAGLRLTEAGTRLAARLELPSAGSVSATLHASTPPPLALGFEQLAQADGARARVEIAWRKLVPPAEFIRRWDAAARNSRAGMVRAYLRRPLWLLRHAPRGFMAWREARRSAKGRDIR